MILNNELENMEENSHGRIYDKILVFARRE
jgi:hypothetical protein